MNPIEDTTISCPYCGEPMGIAVDTTVGDQRFIEDCAVCCQPIEIGVTVDVDADTLSIAAKVAQ